MEMKCRKVEKVMTAFLDGELSGERHRSVAEHLASCERCARSASEAKKVLEWAGTWRDRELSAGFLVRLRARIRREESRAAERRTLWFPKLRWMLAGGAAACVMFLGGYFAALMVTGGKAPVTSAVPVASGEEDSERLIAGLQRIKMVLGEKLSEAAYAQLNEVQRVLAAGERGKGEESLAVVKELQRAEGLVRQEQYAAAREVLDSIVEKHPRSPLTLYARMTKILATPEGGSGSELIGNVYATLVRDTLGDPKEFYDRLSSLPVQMGQIREYGWQKIVESADRLNPIKALDYLEKRLLGGEGTAL